MGFSYPKYTENFNNQNLNSRLTQVNFGLELELHEVFRSQTQSSLTFKGKTTQATKKRKIKRDKEKNNPPTNKTTLNYQRNPPNDCWTGRNQRTAPHLSKKMFPLQSSKLWPPQYRRHCIPRVEKPLCFSTLVLFPGYQVTCLVSPNQHLTVQFSGALTSGVKCSTW